MSLDSSNQSHRPDGYLFTSESVSEGHPDKVADQISDAVLDAFLALDPGARVACETFLADQLVIVAGEFKTANASIFREVEDRAEAIVRETLARIGYTDAESGIDPVHCQVKVAFNHQAREIGQGVDRADGEIGAGDQGLMFGYACNETPELMPLPIHLAHALMRRQAQVRRDGTLPWLRPDAKSQVTVRYKGNTPVGVEKVVLSTQHDAAIDPATLRAEVIKHIIDPVIPEALRQGPLEILINPTGSFISGGPRADTGLTGRKIIVDTYGGSCPHGGGAFSGKDPSKVDRSAAYRARQVAKSIVAAGLADRCTVQLAYAIGTVEPVSFLVDTHGTGKIPDQDLEDRVRAAMSLTPGGIIRDLNLGRPIYAATAAYGHMGRPDLALPWEQVVPLA